VAVQTYHGVPIPDGIWEDWDSSDENTRWRDGVCDAFRVTRWGSEDMAELGRLGPLYRVKEAEQEAAWEADYDRQKAGYDQMKAQEERKQ
jgi:hypothetical protein